MINVSDLTDLAPDDSNANTNGKNSNDQSKVENNSLRLTVGDLKQVEEVDEGAS